MRDNAATIRFGRFDLVWLPPPSFAAELSAGSNPKEYFRLDNSYGSFDERRAMLQDLPRRGVVPVADIVINHRYGLTGWADFRNPNWGVWVICQTDEAFKNPASGVADTPVEQRGQTDPHTGPEDLYGVIKRAVRNAVFPDPSLPVTATARSGPTSSRKPCSS